MQVKANLRLLVLVSLSLSKINAHHVFLAVGTNLTSLLALLFLKDRGHYEQDTIRARCQTARSELLAQPRLGNSQKGFCRILGQRRTKLWLAITSLRNPAMRYWPCGRTKQHRVGKKELYHLGSQEGPGISAAMSPCTEAGADAYLQRSASDFASKPESDRQPNLAHEQF